MEKILKGSVKEVLQRIVRNSGSKIPGIYRNDMLEWIPEAIEEIGGFPSNKYIRKSTPNFNCSGQLITTNHAVALPCGLSEIIAVEDENGYRVRLGSDETDLRHQSTRYHNASDNNPIGNARVVNFMADVFQIEGGITDQVTDTTVPWDDSDLIQRPISKLISYYIIQGDTLQTSEDNIITD